MPKIPLDIQVTVEVTVGAGPAQVVTIGNAVDKDGGCRPVAVKRTGAGVTVNNEGSGWLATVPNNGPLVTDNG